MLAERTTFMNNKLWTFILVTVACFLFGAPLVTAADEKVSADDTLTEATIQNGDQYAKLSANYGGFTTVITVNTTLDTTSDSRTTTCTYDAGIYRPGTGDCSFRRAVVEASARPSEDRPILIQFDIPTTDPNHNNGTWTVVIGGALPNLSRENTLETNGDVTIDGNMPSRRAAGGNNFRIIMNTRGPGDIAGISFTAESDGNTIRNFIWRGGGTIQLNGNNNIVENLWMGLSDDGQSIALEDEDRPEGLAGGGISVQRADNNIIRNNYIVGSTGRAIRVQGDDNQVSNNFVGTRGDGTVPAIPDDIKCRRSTAYVEGLWYGGWGIQILSGSRNQITNNTVAGLHQTQSANDTPPLAIEIGGSKTLVQNNTIGVDSAGSEVGVCGGAIDIKGEDNDILDNRIVGSNKIFEEDQSDTALYASSDRFSGGGITMRGNLVKDSTSKVINFSPVTTDDLRNFTPAAITSIDGTTVIGGNGSAIDPSTNQTIISPCPNCTIELYLDDMDSQEEVLEILAVVQADGNGNFSATLEEPLPEGHGIRTASTTESPFVIGNFIAGTTTKLSELYTNQYKLYMPAVIKP